MNRIRDLVCSLSRDKKWLGRFSPLVLLTALYLALSLLSRLVLWSLFSKESGVSFLQLPAILALGLLNDIIALVYITVPATLYLSLLPVKWFTSPFNRRLLQTGVFTAIFAMLYLGVVEYFFFDEFNSRFNLVAVDYLIYPTEVLVNIWDSYPVGWCLTAVLIISGLLAKLIWRQVSGGLNRSPALRQRLKLAGVHLLLLLAVYTGVSADSFAVSENRIANELAANGVSSFFRAFRTNEIAYDDHYRLLEPDLAFTVMREHLQGSGGAFATANSQSLERSVPPKTGGLGKMNVVVIVEESFGSEFVGALGDKRGLTPNFDRLSREGLLFTKLYASGTRTVRGLEALSLSLPPIPSESVVKRPGSEDMTSWGKVMSQNGYQTSFLYGGYGYFDNMNYFFQSNGFAVSDRSEIVQPGFANIWGVSDEDLFNHAIGYFDKQSAAGKPFFSILMSTSNHKPFTFPAGIPGVPAEGGGRSAGIRYADYALGKFIEQSRNRSWFDNTLFVIVADHGARVYGREQIPIRSYEIPLLIYAPGKIAAGSFGSAMSQIDVAPTVLGLLGLPYRASFYGQDVLSPGAKASTLVFNHNYNVAVMEADQLTVLGLGRKVSAFAYDAGSDRQAAVAVRPQAAELAAAYYQTAYNLFKRHQY
ncbi:MAG: LTA synthase family protein [Sporomusaceae bacterium]|nr:LTA synthase family protein [Sporomusaceae bacterium]